ncbi:hypothetical protein C8F04DRAFT_1198587 [Mycena alexandri]|uniref:Uncharacterized protein n=1 Tax=Mycena alexandri TaxID=1745969 RepID=A0AAD6S4D0_9AGAR|nr:hypothetical protein C8F04DRAFT_1198587 [Mycena alexandri]
MGWAEGALKRGAGTDAAGGAEKLAAWREWRLAAWTQGGGCEGAGRGAGTSEAAGSGSERGEAASGRVSRRARRDVSAWQRRAWDPGAAGRGERRWGGVAGGVGCAGSRWSFVKSDDVAGDGGVDASAVFGGIHATGWEGGRGRKKAQSRGFTGCAHLKNQCGMGGDETWWNTLPRSQNQIGLPGILKNESELGFLE